MAIRVTRYESMPDLVGEPLAKGRECMALQVDPRTHYDPICEQLMKEKSLKVRQQMEIQHVKELRERSQTRWDTYYCIDADWADKWSQYVNEQDESKLKPPGPVNNNQLTSEL